MASGITVTSGFILGVNEPLDKRLVVDTYENLLNYPADTIYEGMIVYVKEYQVNYQYKNGEWESFSVEVQDTLDSYSTVKGLSANQGRVLNEKIETHKQETDETIKTLATIEYVDAKFEEEGGGGGNANIHVGEEAPEDTTYLWIDTSTPYNLDPNTYEGRLRLNYLSMLNKTLTKIHKIEQGISLIAEKIKEISSENTELANSYKEQLSTIKTTLSDLKMQVEEIQIALNGDGVLDDFKTTSKTIRKQVRELFFSMLKLKDTVLSLLDEEKAVDASSLTPGGDEDDTDGTILATETGEFILTEDGLLLLLDGVNSSEILADAILTELGLVLLTEDEKQILKG